MLERIIELTAENLGADAATNHSRDILLKMIFMQIPWISLSLQWHSRKNFL